jgi:hypothetical protein
MVKLCISKLGSSCYSSEWDIAIATAIRERNTKIFEWLLGHAPLNGSSSFHRAIEETIFLGDRSFVNIWVSFMETKLWERSVGRNGLRQSLGTRDVVQATANNRIREELLLHLWRSIRWEKRDTKQAKRYFGEMLLNVADTTCSLVLAEYLLECGAEVDHQRSPKYSTPLYKAAQQDTREAAALMKWLLIHGADPSQEPSERNDNFKLRYKPPLKIQDRKGALGISKWLGITWDELVKETQGLKKAKTGETTVNLNLS